MRQAIQQIIQEDVAAGCIFDSHFIINRLIKSKTLGDAYLAFARLKAQTNVSQLHGLIGQEIDALVQGGLIERMMKDGQELESCSETIHGDPGHCACWRRK
jgi:hypothetical protein